MLNRRFHLCGLLAVLLALMAQLGTGASVPQMDPIAVAGVLCHSEDEGGGAPSHPVDCPACPLCLTLHVQAVTLPAALPVAGPPPLLGLLRTELPPPSTAAPTSYRPPSQPRAPPAYS